MIQLTQLNFVNGQAVETPIFLALPEIQGFETYNDNGMKLTEINIDGEWLVVKEHAEEIKKILQEHTSRRLASRGN